MKATLLLLYRSRVRVPEGAAIVARGATPRRVPPLI